MLEGAQNQYEISSRLVDENESIEHYIEKLFLSAVMIFFLWFLRGFLHRLQRRKKKSNLDGFFSPQLLIFPDTGVTYNKLLLFSSEMFGFKFLDHFTVNNFQLNFWFFALVQAVLNLP